MTPDAVLAIGGSDPTCASGVAADLKTIHACGGYGAIAITAVTAQSSTGVTSIVPIEPTEVARQIEAASLELDLKFWKVGMVFERKIAESISESVGSEQPLGLVVDPVGIASSGGSLFIGNSLGWTYGPLIQQATLLTPNLSEAEELVDRPINTIRKMHEAAIEILAMGPRWVLVKGGHMDSGVTAGQANDQSPQSVDILTDGQDSFMVSAPRVQTVNDRGTGCTLASATATFLASGMDVPNAVLLARCYLAGALSAAPPTAFRSGRGAMAHLRGRSREDCCLSDEPTDDCRENRFGVRLVDIPTPH